MVDWEALEIELVPEERELILQYGYPFSDVKEQLEKHASSPHVEVLVISRFYLKHLLGELACSINNDTKGNVQLALNDLCDRLEMVERYGDGELEEW